MKYRKNDVVEIEYYGNVFIATVIDVQILNRRNTYLARFDLRVKNGIPRECSKCSKRYVWFDEEMVKDLSHKTMLCLSGNYQYLPSPTEEQVDKEFLEELRATIL